MTTGIRDCLISVHGEKIVDELLSHKDEARECLEKTYGVEIANAILSEDSDNAKEDE